MSSSDEPVRTWVFVGDSVTAAGRDRSRPDDLGRGWVADVGRRLQQADPGARVVNLGVSGDRAADVRDRVVDDLAAARVAGPGVVVTLAVGINDVRRAHLEDRPFDPRAFAKAYAAVLPRVAATLGAGPPRLLLVEPVLAPLDDGQRGWADDVDEVCDYLGHLAAAQPAPVVRVRRTFARESAARVTRDGIHPTPAGHRLLADAWWATAADVPGLLPEGAAQVLAGSGPRWWDRVRLRLARG